MTSSAGAYGMRAVRSRLFSIFLLPGRRGNAAARFPTMNARNNNATYTTAHASRSIGFTRQAWHKWVRKLGLRPTVLHDRLHLWTDGDIRKVRDARSAR